MQKSQLACALTRCAAVLQAIATTRCSRARTLVRGPPASMLYFFSMPRNCLQATVLV